MINHWAWTIELEPYWCFGPPSVKNMLDLYARPVIFKPLNLTNALPSTHTLRVIYTLLTNGVCRAANSSLFHQLGQGDIGQDVSHQHNTKPHSQREEWLAHTVASPFLDFWVSEFPTSKKVGEKERALQEEGEKRGLKKMVPASHCFNLFSGCQRKWWLAEGTPDLAKTRGPGTGSGGR